MGVISNTMPLKPSDQPRHIKTPADNPQNPLLKGLSAQEIIQMGMVWRAFSIRDQFRRTDARHEAGRLLFNAQSSTMKPTAGARNQKADQCCGQGSGSSSCLGAAGALATGKEAKEHFADGRHQVSFKLFEHVHVQVESLVRFLNNAISRCLIDRQLIHG